MINQVELPDEQPAMRIIAMPKDANAGGSIFGGWIMSQIDMAGAVVAISRAKGRVATVKVNSLEFKQPVFVGDLLSCYANVVDVGKSSITVEVKVYAQRNSKAPETIKVTQAELIYVALDEDRKPRLVPDEIEKVQ